MAENSTETMRGGGPLILKNVLNKSRSPYVRGHMSNPVAWQMWNSEAIALAKAHNKLLFVSIGYAACHWCHVMEHESFENHEVAKMLNSHFIPIKIDREERPDVDRIYMNYVQATTGHGGWPLNVFITPDLEPIFGGTYFPTGGLLGLLEKIKTVWENQRERCLLSAKAVTEQLRNFAQEGNLGATKTSEDDSEVLELELLEESYEHYASKFDKLFAGFGGAPKFPTPAHLSFLLCLGQYPTAVRDVVGLSECENAKMMVIKTLREMSRGGIHDQIGNGFARYSVTRDWSLPHFEKMLYDQGQLLNAYLDAFLITGDAEMLGAVYDIANYLTLPPLAAKDGGYFSSEDADSLYRPTDAKKREGAFYVWTHEEFQSILGERDAKILAKFYNVKKHGNVNPEHDTHHELVNQNVLATTTSPNSLAKDYNLSKDEIVEIIKTGRAKLLEHRNRERPRPDLDDKIVVAWNGLAIGALARTSAVLDSIDKAKAEEYRASAIKAAKFIKTELFNSTTKSMRRVYREGPGDAPAFADDYAYFIHGLVELYEATFDDQYLEFADTLQKTQNVLFGDETGGGFYSTQAGQPDIILRLKDGMDNAEPGTNGVSASNLYRLGSFLEDQEYIRLAKKTCSAFSTEMVQHPYLFSSMMGSVVAGHLGMRSIVLTGNSPEVESAVFKSRSRLKPNTTIVRLGGAAKGDWLMSRNELLRSMDVSKSRLQVCEKGVCRDDFSPADIEKALSNDDG